MAKPIKNEQTTTMQISMKLRNAILDDRVRDETYEDVIWRWRGKHKGKPTTVNDKIAKKI